MSSRKAANEPVVPNRERCGSVRQRGPLDLGHAFLTRNELKHLRSLVSLTQADVEDQLEVVRAVFALAVKVLHANVVLLEDLAQIGCERLHVRRMTLNDQATVDHGGNRDEGVEEHQHDEEDRRASDRDPVLALPEDDADSGDTPDARAGRDPADEVARANHRSGTEKSDAGHDSGAHSVRIEHESTGIGQASRFLGQVVARHDQNRGSEAHQDVSPQTSRPAVDLALEADRTAENHCEDDRGPLQ